MTGSSARNVQYDLRPAKQTERMLIVDILKLIGTAGLPIQSYPYVGLGGSVFYDFQLIFRYLGLQRMTSIEHSKHLLPRCEFNKPYKFIRTFQGTTSEYMIQRGFNEPTLVWLDYDWRLSSMATSDIELLGASLPEDSVFLITLCAEPPKAFAEKRMDASERVNWLEEELQAASANCTVADVTNSKFRFYVERVIKNAVQYAFAARTQAEPIPFLSAFYKDSAWMYTYGAVFTTGHKAKALRKLLRQNFPFLQGSTAYEIANFNLSQKERKLLDKVCTSKSFRKRAPASLSKLGFSDADVKAYANLMRFVPHYTETLI